MTQMERTRDVNISAGVDASLRHARYAFRSLCRTPGFAATVVVTLAIGIGANSVVFSVLNAVLLRPLPYPDASRLVILSQISDARRNAETLVAPVRLEDWQRLTTTFEGITGYYVEDMSETSGDLPERVRRANVGPRFFDVWRVPPAIGRGFTEAESHSAPLAAVISNRLWRRRFAQDPDVIGRSIRFGAQSIPIVGVMPPSFAFPDRTVDVWTPVATDAPTAQSRQATWYTAIGSLKRGVSQDQARSDLAAVQQRLAAQYPATDRGLRVHLVSLQQSAVASARASLWLLFGAVCVLLLITCTNVASLLIARAAARRHEMAVRVALGARRTTIAAQVFVETGVLAVAGAAVGVVVALLLVPVLRALPADLPRLDEVALDVRTIAYTAAVSLAVTFICGCLPAMSAMRGPSVVGIAGAARGEVAGRSRLQWWLVAAQITLSVALLAGAGLLVRSAWALGHVTPGFDASHILAFRLSGTYAELNNFEAMQKRIDAAAEELRALPGIQAVATAGSVPGVPTDYELTFEAPSGGAVSMAAASRVVSPEYFATMGIALEAGDLCRRRPRGMADLMVNRAFVQRYLSAPRSAIGLELTIAGNNPSPHPIVGIVGDARERGLDREPSPTVYSCVSAGTPTPYFLVRTNGDPTALASAVRLRMKALEPMRSVYELGALADRIGDAFAQNRLRTLVLGFFAMTALVLASVGLYGTLSYATRLRRREVALRLALGARRGTIVGAFVAHALKVAAGASLAGAFLSLAGSRALVGMLYGVTPSDPVTLVSVIGIVMVVALLAAAVPAARGAGVDPMRVLREE